MLDNIKSKNIEILYLLHIIIHMKFLFIANNAEDVNSNNIELKSF